MRATKPVVESTEYVEYSSLKLEGEKPVAASKKKVTKKAVSKKKTSTRVKKAVGGEKKALGYTVDQNVVKKEEKKTSNPDKPLSKMSIAIEIFNNNYPKMKRKDILVLFMTEADMGKNYASTAYQILKKATESEEG